MLQSVVIDKVSFIEVCIPTDLLTVVLIDHPHVLRQIALIVESVQALARPQLAKAVDLLRLLLVCRSENPFVGDKRVTWLLEDTVDFILDIAEATQACLSFQL